MSLNSFLFNYIPLTLCNFFFCLNADQLLLLQMSLNYLIDNAKFKFILFETNTSLSLNTAIKLKLILTK